MEFLEDVHSMLSLRFHLRVLLVEMEDVLLVWDNIDCSRIEYACMLVIVDLDNISVLLEHVLLSVQLVGNNSIHILDNASLVLQDSPLSEIDVWVQA